MHLETHQLALGFAPSSPYARSLTHSIDVSLLLQSVHVLIKKTRDINHVIILKER